MARNDIPSAADLAFLLAQQTRLPPRRARGWTGPRIVTFIVTLAAGGCVTRAAAAAGLSRKSAYALQGRDAAFARLWDEAIAAHRRPSVGATSGKRRRPGKGNEADETDTPPGPAPAGDNRPSQRAWADARRDSFFAGLCETRPTVPRP